MARYSHGPRTFRLLRAEGWSPETVERTIPRWRKGQDEVHDPGGWMPTGKADLFGFADVLCLPIEDMNKGLLAVQMCSQSTYAEHERKLVAEPRLAAFLRAGKGVLAVEIWSWSKRKYARGSVAVRWWLKRYRARILFVRDHEGPEVSFHLVDEVGPDHPLSKVARALEKAIKSTPVPS